MNPGVLLLFRSLDCGELHQCEMGNKGAGGDHNQQVMCAYYDHHHRILLHHQRYVLSRQLCSLDWP